MDITLKKRRALEKKYWVFEPLTVISTSFILGPLSVLGIRERDFKVRNFPYMRKLIRGNPLGKNFRVIEGLVDSGYTIFFNAYHSDYIDGPWEKWKFGIVNKKN